MTKSDRLKASNLAIDAMKAFNAGGDATDPLISALLLAVEPDGSKAAHNLRSALLNYRTDKKAAA